MYLEANPALPSPETSQRVRHQTRELLRRAGERARSVERAANAALGRSNADGLRVVVADLAVSGRAEPDAGDAGDAVDLGEPAGPAGDGRPGGDAVVGGVAGWSAGEVAEADRSVRVGSAPLSAARVGQVLRGRAEIGVRVGVPAAADGWQAYREQVVRQFGSQQRPGVLARRMSDWAASLDVGEGELLRATVSLAWQLSSLAGWADRRGLWLSWWAEQASARRVNTAVSTVSSGLPDALQDFLAELVTRAWDREDVPIPGQVQRFLRALFLADYSLQFGAEVTSSPLITAAGRAHIAPYMLGDGVEEQVRSGEFEAESLHYWGRNRVWRRHDNQVMGLLRQDDTLDNEAWTLLQALNGLGRPSTGLALVPYSRPRVGSDGGRAEQDDGGVDAGEWLTVAASTLDAVVGWFHELRRTAPPPPDGTRLGTGQGEGQLCLLDSLAQLLREARPQEHQDVTAQTLLQQAWETLGQGNLVVADGLAARPTDFYGSGFLDWLLANYHVRVQIWEDAGGAYSPHPVVGHEGPLLRVAYRPGHYDPLLPVNQEHPAPPPPPDTETWIPWTAPENQRTASQRVPPDPRFGVVRVQHDAWVMAVAFGRVGDLDLLATAGADGTVWVWDATGLRAITLVGQPLRGHTDDVTAVVFGRVGGLDLLATAGADGTVRVWDASDPRAITPLGQPLRGHTDAVMAVVFGRVGGLDLLATASFDGTVRVWDASDPRAITPVGEPLRGHTGAVWAVVFGRVGGLDLLATASFDGTARVWDASDPHDIAPVGEPLHGHTGRVWAVVFGRVGGLDLLATASDDGTVRVWDASDPRAITLVGQPLRGHDDWVRAVVFGRVGGLDVLAT
ncbi:WD40 repeat domain-containing protein, partial [Micromonospora sp. NPDC023814]|uniref:WD40 repeat domain-containing protein n=1 Tax=Micromonospora sp. NPDC023814 TaxID=3154596 RepID=UPI00340A9480